MYSCVDLTNTFRITAIYTAFQEKFHITYSFSGESHNFYEIVIVTEGTVGVTAGSDIYILRQGQAIIHEPMEFHGLWSEENSSPSVIIFSFRAENLPNYSSKIFNIDDISVPKNILEQIYSSFRMEKAFATAVIKEDGVSHILAVKYLEEFILKTLSQNPGKGGKIQSRSAKNYASIVNILNNNIDKILTVSDIAKMCNMSESSVKKTFSRHLGIGIMNYFNRLKITASISMLQNGYSIKETASLLGFQNQNYFSTVFKRIMGNSPSFYKNHEIV